MKMITVRSDRPPWITDEILESIQNRDEAFEEAYILKDPNLLIEAKRLRTISKKAVRNARSSYIQFQLHENSGNPRKLWLEIIY